MKAFLGIYILCFFLCLPLAALKIKYKHQLNLWSTVVNMSPIKIKLTKKVHYQYVTFIHIPPLPELLAYQLVSLLLIIIIFIENN